MKFNQSANVYAHSGILVGEKSLQALVLSFLIHHQLLITNTLAN